ncbi:TIGR03089 family protein [Rhodococcus aerolatus]
MTVTDALLRPILDADPAGPRVTYYDDATGERVEVSGLTLANWAAKTANLLRDELGVSPGDRVTVALPAHWQTVAVLLGAWWCGAVVDDPAAPAPADAAVALCTADRLAEVDDAPEQVVLSLDAFGRPAPDLPVGVTDYATAVRVHGDAFVAPRVGDAAPALAARSVGDVVAAARASAAAQGLTRSDRVLSAAGWESAAALTDGLLAVLAAGASLVQVSHPDEARLTRRVESEKVTRTLGA